MAGMQNGAFPVVKAFGIQVYIHWSWLLMAAYEISRGSEPLWQRIAFYLMLFGSVLLHEFGHSLACRQVGGTTRDILLWPMGGIAYVSPPQRPGAQLWSIAAGPLVNVAIAACAYGVLWLEQLAGTVSSLPEVHTLVTELFQINVGLLLFNILPIYPLDGGQIARSLLWFIVGRATSLMIVAGLSIVTIVVCLPYLLQSGGTWWLLLAAFAGMQAYRGLREGLQTWRLTRAPRYVGIECGECHQSPPIGDFWFCRTPVPDPTDGTTKACNTKFDFFACEGECPKCGTRFSAIPCAHCGAMMKRQSGGE